MNRFVEQRPPWPCVARRTEHDDILTGGCACGGVRFLAYGRPLRVGLCHCIACRKAHASAFNPFVVFSREQVRITGDLTIWRSSPQYHRSFCPACGSRVIGGAIDGPEVELSLGGFDDVGRLEPHYESWIIRREPWLSPLPVDQHPGDRPQV